jgi:hypothetical protein
MRRTPFLIAALLLAPWLHAADEPAALDVTLIVGGDVEIGKSDRGMTERIARNHALAMSKLLGTDGQRLRWPDGTSQPGTTVAAPAGIFIAGDLADDNTIGGANGKLLEELYLGPNPAAGAPGYLGWGNHDVYAHDWWFTPQGATNNNNGHALIRRQQTDVVSRFDQNFGILASTPPHYAVRKGRLLIVHLNTSLGEPCRKANLVGDRYDIGIYAESSAPSCAGQQWLRDTLASHKSTYGEKAPVIVVQHYGYDGAGTGVEGYRGYWWHPDAREAFETIVSSVNLIGFFHGHAHEDLLTPKGTRYENQPIFRGDTTSPKLDVGYSSGGRAWADFNGDGLLDYCRVVDANGKNGKASCRLFRGRQKGFDDHDITSPQLDAGWSEGRAFVDVNNDRRADFCRVTGSSNGGNQTIRCTLSNGDAFGNEISAHVDVGYPGAGRTWADFDNDGRADYCRVVGADSGNGKVSCALSTGSGFGRDIASGTLDVGYWQGRAFVDVDNDKRVDYCRVVDANTGNGKVRCTLSLGSAFGGSFEAPLDVGFTEGRTWADANADGRADYCRVTDANSALGVVRCRLSNGASFGDDITSATGDVKHVGIDVGWQADRMWADFNGDRRADYCRVALDGRVECTMSTGSAFPAAWSVRSLPLEDAGYDGSRIWADVDNDRRADFCRVIDSNSGQGRVRCTFATAVTTVVPFDSYGVASGYCGGGGIGGFTVVRVTDTRMDVVPVRKTTTHCSDDEYDGSVTVNTDLVRSVPIATR